MQMSRGSLATLTFCKLPLGLVGSHFQGGSQMQWTPAGDGTETYHARSSMKIFENSPS